jgi:hypothetical protein
VGRDAGLSPHAADRGWVADRRDRTRQPQDPSEHRRRRQDPRDLTAVPRTARRIKSGATACAQPTCGPDPRTSEWRSADPRRSDAVLANLSPATTRPASTTGEHQELLTDGFPLDGAVPYQKVKRVGHGFRNFTNYRLRILLVADGSRPYRQRPNHA